MTGEARGGTLAVAEPFLDSWRVVAESLPPENAWRGQLITRSGDRASVGACSPFTCGCNFYCSRMEDGIDLLSVQVHGLSPLS